MPEKVFLKVCQYGDRKITVLDGIAFYQSTGSNSGHRGAWFPMFGVRLKDRRTMSWQPVTLGPWFVKPSQDTFCGASFLVSVDLDIENIGWFDIPETMRTNAQSVVLLQRQSDGTLYARYLSQEYKSCRAFSYGTLKNITAEEYSMFFDSGPICRTRYLMAPDVLFDQLNTARKKIRDLDLQFQSKHLDLSFEQLSIEEKKELIHQYKFINRKLSYSEEDLHIFWTQCTDQDKYTVKLIPLRDAENTAERRYRELPHKMHQICAKFYHAVFTDSRLGALPVIEGKAYEGFDHVIYDPDMVPAERVLNVSMLENAQRLYQIEPETSSDKAAQTLADVSKEVIASSGQVSTKASIAFQEQITVCDRTNIRQSVVDVNAWIRRRGGLVLPEDQEDPLALFKQCHAMDNWIVFQRLRCVPADDIVTVLQSMGFDKKDIGISIKHADSWMQSEIKKLARSIAQGYWKYGSYNEYGVKTLVDKSSIGPFLSDAKKEQLLTWLKASETKTFETDSVNQFMDRITQLIKSLFRCDRASKCVKDLNTYFLSQQQRLFFRNTESLTQTPDQNCLSLP